MRMLRYLFAIAALCCLPVMARASVSFQMVVVDPLPDYVHVITSSDLMVTLGTCQTGQVPMGAGDPTYDGCYTFLNDTGSAITSLQILIPVGTGTPSCPLAPGSFFTTLSCDTTTSNGLDWIFDFSGGTGIPTATDCDHDGDGGDLNSDDFSATCNADTIFTIAESGIPVGDFPTNFSVTGNSVVATPEPSSVWLLSSGILSLGLLSFYRRKHKQSLVPMPSLTCDRG